MFSISMLITAFNMVRAVELTNEAPEVVPNPQVAHTGDVKISDKTAESTLADLKKAVDEMKLKELPVDGELVDAEKILREGLTTGEFLEGSEEEESETTASETATSGAVEEETKDKSE